MRHITVRILANSGLICHIDMGCLGHIVDVMLGVRSRPGESRRAFGRDSPRNHASKFVG